MQPSGSLTRKKILYAFVQVFLKKGCEGATAKKIAALAGISRGSPFGMFGNKEGELRSAYEDSANSNTYNYVYADKKIDLTAFTVEAKVSFRSHNNVSVSDELYVFVSGFEPGLNTNGLGVVWITGGGGRAGAAGALCLGAGRRHAGARRGQRLGSRDRPDG